MDMNKYRNIGFKLTPQRLAILSYLEGNKEHPSAEEIFRAVSDKYPTMSFATVYNTLAALSRKGNILELSIDPHKRRYDPNTSMHNHLICVSCKKIEDIHHDYNIVVPDSLKNGFEITGNHIEFYGICPECRKQKST
jgi:Fur family transcriptional regulator, peroxide stress response regulator